MSYFYKTDEMEKGLAGEDYSPTEGAWVTGERIIFGKMRIPPRAARPNCTHTPTSSSPSSWPGLAS